MPPPLVLTHTVFDTFCLSCLWKICLQLDPSLLDIDPNAFTALIPVGKLKMAFEFGDEEMMQLEEEALEVVQRESGPAADGSGDAGELVNGGVQWPDAL